MSTVKSPAKFVASWKHEGKEYRLSSKGRYSVTFEEDYYLERKDQDLLGGDKWTLLSNWAANDHEAMTVMVSGIKDAIKP